MPTNNEVMRRFAEQCNGEPEYWGRASAGSVIARGPRLYSYGEHYLLARLDHGSNVAHLNTRNSSVTTAKHRSMARRELLKAGWKVLDAPNL